jgi:hypothetical protein
MHNKTGLGGAALLLICLVAARASGQQAEISSELARLRGKLSSMKLNFDEDKAAYLTRISRSEDALRAGRLYVSLFNLQGLMTALSAHEYINSKEEIRKQGKAAFESDWRGLGKELAGKQKRIASALRTLPAAVRALVQASQHQSRVYYQSGRLYGLETTLDSGHYYMGLARGYLDFGLFCIALRFDGAPAKSVMRPPTDELARLETEILNAYKKSDPNDQPRYNNLNSTLKLAAELDQSKMVEGALEKYLEASMQLGLIVSPAASGDALPAIKERVQAARQRLAAAGQDNSIGLLFVEMAENAVMPSEGEASADSLRRASVILDEVLPRYFKFIPEVK